MAGYEYDYSPRVHQNRAGQWVTEPYDVIVKIKRLHPDAVIPEYATYGAAGFDLVAVEDVIIQPGETKRIRTGLAFEIPRGYELQIRMRSGIALRTKLRLPNSVGTIDSDYRGEVFMMFENTYPPIMVFDPKTQTVTPAIVGGPLRNIEGEQEDVWDQEGAYIIRKGDRIAQGIIAPVMMAKFEVVDELSKTERGDGGFGSTGVRSE